MDPWQDCERIYDNHFMDRMGQRFLPKEKIITILKEGSRINEKENDYKIKWKKWTLKASLGSCFVYLWTAYHK